MKKGPLFVGGRVRWCWIIVALALAACSGTGSVEEGRMLYAENGCASCHGSLGQGDGVISRQLDPPPTDLRRVESFKLGSDLDAIARTIETGVATVPAALRGPEHAQHRHSQGMPPFAHLTARERRTLARYILSIQNESREGRHP